MLPTPILLLTLLSVPDGSPHVILPVQAWDMLRDAGREPEPPSPPVAVAAIDRALSGAFERGLFRAALIARFEVLGDAGHVRVPLVDSRASLGTVTLDGKKTSVLRDGELYTIGVDSPGRHEARLELFVGRQQDRFARRIELALPDGGPTSFRIRIPEQDIEARLGAGALVSTKAAGAGTELVGQLDVSGRLDLSWVRKLRHEQPSSVRTEARIQAVVTVQEALVTGLAAVDLDVLEGETDRVDLSLPSGVEVSAVEGESVLQWRTEAKDGKLVVLLKHLVEDHTSWVVRFQYPVESQSVSIRIPFASEGTPVSGALGITAPAGLDVRIASPPDSAEVLGSRDIPSELADLATSPLLYAFGFTTPPSVSLAVTRHKDVELTSTIVDELQASTILMESGSEITKLKLRIRNNTRQYLEVRLPVDAVLTHSLIDGQPIRPAVAGRSETGAPEELLLPLRQSERIGAGKQRAHIIRPGETLSDVANIYYSDPSLWEKIHAANAAELDGAELQAGQRIVVPALHGTVEESSFVVELAYRRARRELSTVGSLVVALPELDVDTVVAVWHVYLPERFDPISVSSNLTPYSKIRYDPFRRIRGYLELALGTRSAWAGGSEYRSILSQRKEIWHAENEKKTGGELVLSSFPLTGERLRFKRILLGRETPRLSVVYASSAIGHAMRLLAFVLAFALVFRALSPDSTERRRRFVTAGLGFLALLVLAHFFLGMHRRILWGVDLAMLVSILLPMAPRVLSRLRELAESPWLVAEWVTFRNLLVLIGLEALLVLVILFPLLSSSIAFVALAFMARGLIRGVEVRHAS
ncbi:MAG: LysM peptidoglycan-binding domain-containing protein [Deltaproteobacteria bacterium]|nr:LysM peptidoglycan-binding domain-containing protein [Deltaproteobacteria bacterium]